MATPGVYLNLGKYGDQVRKRIQLWHEEGFTRRLWSKDPTLWFAAKVPEITDRLGWLDLPETMSARVAELTAFATEVKDEGIRHAVLMGMGGSSLAPAVFQRTFGNRNECPELLVLDSTHPAAILRVRNLVDLNRTLFLVSSKSGTTTETLSGFSYFWQQLLSLESDPGRRFVAITDPGTPLEKLAQERGFRKVFAAPEDIGGRYSALSVFGLVPAALIGVEVARLLQSARVMATSCAAEGDGNPGLVLGAILGELALKGKDKVTFVASPGLDAFPDWIEQLIAESTGKNGKGILPVAGEAPLAADNYSSDRVFVYLRLEGERNEELDLGMKMIADAGHPSVRIDLADAHDLGGEFFRWEVAVAAAGAALEIHPFDQPDVQLAKDLARQAMEKQSHARSGGGSAGSREAAAGDSKETVEQELKQLISEVKTGDYVAIQAYLCPLAEVTSALHKIRRALRDRLRVATTLGYGPRFLHSTGQLHKGGPNTGVFLQLTDQPPDDVAVPQTQYTFGQLIQAQAGGDQAALRQRGRRVHHLDLGAEFQAGLKTIVDAIEKSG
ncbi:MAG: hypothetical protein ACREQW_23825 [Candidatus Binatia bacterium]